MQYFYSCLSQVPLILENVNTPSTKIQYGKRKVNSKCVYLYLVVMSGKDMLIKYTSHVGTAWSLDGGQNGRDTQMTCKHQFLLVGLQK